ncbi:MULTISPECIES: alpha/beta hydrolase [unclassified Leptolyngbya]|uniref:alpha/beta hydrolase n=1 Tax=unclassified Leptolyngbya TaxID=2650499 RepID=UPI00168A0CC9|nr:MULTISPECIES: alpha/beta hydrolase [unclassified Leptolyngbya]MBD1910885.1 alpha/beta hydrolase [Leptolyngbya sp. FACHB-8]MBD2153720.1 alpha/beta hydrolase [Leptolyngbya sp. FACHB-16]
MIVVVTNRNINEGETGENLFGEKPNEVSLDELRIAIANHDESNERWQVELLPEPDAMNEANVPSKRLFNRIITAIGAGELKADWLFYVHGFNQSFRGNLEECRRLEQTYGVNIIAFSWPSNQGGFISNEYRDARAAARASSLALDRTLEKLGRYIEERNSMSRSQGVNSEGCSIRLNFMCYSLGCFLVQEFIKSPIFGGETRIFDNVIFQQADVDNKNHYTWIDLINSRRIYVTINERDAVLKASDIINPARLGNTAERLIAERPIYVDFTDAENVGSSHDIFLGIEGNEVITQFCQRVITGGRGELVRGFKYDAYSNTFRVDE